MASLAKNMNFKLDINPPPNGELWGENKNGTFTGIYSLVEFQITLKIIQYFLFKGLLDNFRGSTLI